MMGGGQLPLTPIFRLLAASTRRTERFYGTKSKPRSAKLTLAEIGQLELQKMKDPNNMRRNPVVLEAMERFERWEREQVFKLIDHGYSSAKIKKIMGIDNKNWLVLHALYELKKAKK